MSSDTLDVGKWSEVIPLPGSEKPPHRTYFTLDVVNGKSFLFGGFSQSGTSHNDLYEWIEREGWSKVKLTAPRSALNRHPLPVYMHASAAARNRLWVFGGQSSKPDNAVFAYTPANQSWSAYGDKCANAPSVRHGHTMVNVEDNLLIIGGRVADLTFTSEVLRFDTSSYSWSVMTSLPVSMAYHFSFVYNNEVYVFGGYNSDGLNDKMYVLRSGRWVEVVFNGDKKPKGRCGIANALHGKHLYTYGGFSNTHSNEFDRFDLETLQWTELNSENGPMPRAYGQMFVNGDSLFIIGGYDGSRCVSDFRRLELPHCDGSVSALANRSVAIPYMTTPKERAEFIFKYYTQRGEDTKQEEKSDNLYLSLDDLQALMADLSFRPSLVRALLGVRPPTGISVTDTEKLLEADKPTDLAIEDDDDDDESNYITVYDFDTEHLPELLDYGFSKDHILQIMYNMSQKQIKPTIQGVMNDILDTPYDATFVIPSKRVHKYGGGLRVRKPRKAAISGTNENALASSDNWKEGRLQDRITELESEITNLRDLTTCTICYDKPYSHALQPCGHVLCDICASSSGVNCPFCRMKVFQKLKLHK